jgi:hypothetical protein
MVEASERLTHPVLGTLGWLPEYGHWYTPLWLPSGRWDETGWTAEQPAMLGTLPDERLAACIGRTPTAVRVMRNRLGIASARDRRRTGRGVMAGPRAGVRDRQGRARCGRG